VCRDADYFPISKKPGNRDYIKYQVTLLLSAAFIMFHSSFLYNTTLYVDENIVTF
jgi:hypothetical protein